MADERAVVVGAGGIAKAWFPALVAENVDVLAVVDLNIDAARQGIEDYQLAAKASTDLGATLRDTTPDFVIDLTVPEAHCEVTCKALEAGCHVIGEKPMAASMEQARTMVATAERTGKLYMVSQSRRWDAKHDVICRAIASDAIGQLTTINCDFYIGAHFGGFRDQMPSPLILDMAIHHFDLARAFSVADPVAVYAHEFNPAGSWYAGDAAATCIFEMSNGAVFTYRGSWCAEGFHTSWNGDWRLIGDKGTLIYAGDRDPVAQTVAEPSANFHRALADVPLPEPQLEHPTMRGALREMLAFLRDGTPPQTECHDNIQSLAMVFAAIESAATGRRVSIQI